jgi:hypothetical protein
MILFKTTPVKTSNPTELVLLATSACALIILDRNVTISLYAIVCDYDVGSFYCVDVGSVSDVTEVFAASIFRVDANREDDDRIQSPKRCF